MAKLSSALAAALSVLLVGALAAAEPAAPAAATLEGFSPRAGARQLEIESLLAASLSPRRIGEDLRRLSERPHLTGTEGTRQVVELLHRELAAAGFETETVRYVGYLPSPISVSLELVEPVAEPLPTTEEVIPGDPYTLAAAEHPGWNGYAPSGVALGQVVYGHHGSEEDLRRLERMGIELEGKILLLRNFNTGEGRKVRNAARFGAAGVVLYTDPAEDGFRFGDVYPAGNWRPPGSIMRRSILLLPYEGDPLSPGWASLPGAPRLDPSEVDLPSIPVLPVSYRTAERILSLLSGPPAPAEWQGALPLTYRIGPGPARLRIATEMDLRDRPMLDVVGRLEGAVEPDQWVLLGNHHDAWIYGAGDPSSGTAALLELARGLGELARRGMRPRRTVIVAFWDAEEMVLGGSTEWLEEHAAELAEKAVAVVNMDSAVFNPERPLSVAAHPALHGVFREAARDVRMPEGGETLFAAWRDLQNRFRRVPGVDGWGEFFDPAVELAEPWIFEIPYDDAGPFYNLLALPASDMYYGADYGMYHSLYENFHWMSTVVDPGFAYHALMAELQGRVALRLANAELPPLDFPAEARYWRWAYEDLGRVAAARDQEVPGLALALDAIAQWESEAAALRREIAERLAADEATSDQPWPAAAAIARAARDFWRPAGRPGAPADRNLFAGSSLDFEGVSGSTLPGVRFALDRGDPAAAAAEAEVYLAALARRVETLRSIRRQLAQTSERSPR